MGTWLTWGTVWQLRVNCMKVHGVLLQLWCFRVKFCLECGQPVKTRAEGGRRISVLALPPGLTFSPGRQQVWVSALVPQCQLSRVARRCGAPCPGRGERWRVPAPACPPGGSPGAPGAPWQGGRGGARRAAGLCRARSRARRSPTLWRRSRNTPAPPPGRRVPTREAALLPAGLGPDP